MAERSCFGGACYYLFPEEVTNTVAEEGESRTAAMMKTYNLSNVVPNIQKQLPDLSALVLGKALLWLIYSPYDASNLLVPQAFKDRIRLELNEIVTATVREVDCNAPDCNPIRLVPVVVTGDQGCVYINVVPVFDKHQAAVGIFCGTRWCWDSWWRRRSGNFGAIAVSSGSSMSDSARATGVANKQNGGQSFIHKAFHGC